MEAAEQWGGEAGHGGRVEVALVGGDQIVRTLHQQRTQTPQDPGPDGGRNAAEVALGTSYFARLFD